MALLRKFFYRRPPEGLTEISENIFVFDYCFSMEFFEEDELKPYIGGIIKQLYERYSIDSFMVFNFEAGKKDSEIARIFSDYGTSVMGYPRNYEGCPLLTMEMIHHFLRSGESWLSLGQENFLLMHSEQGGWPVLAFTLAALLIYLQRYTDERTALEMVYRQAPSELVELFSPLDPVPSQLRYLQYVSRRHVLPKLWPPADRALNLNCAIIRKIPNFDGQGGCRPIFRIYGPDPLMPNDKSTKVLFSIPKNSDFVQLYRQEDCEIIKVNVRCHVQGDVVLECISLDEDLEREVMVFRVMFNTAFVEDNILVLDRDQIDILWDTKHRFPADFRIEVIFSEMDATTSIRTTEISSEEKESLSVEAVAKVKQVFSDLDWSIKKDGIAVDASQPNTSKNSHDNFDELSLEEPEVDEITPELSHSLPKFNDEESVDIAYFLQKSEADDTARELSHDILAVEDAFSLDEITPEHSHSSMPKFDNEEEAVTDAYSLQKPEVLAPNFQDDEVFEDASSLDGPEVDHITHELSPDMAVLNFQDSEAVAEWSEANMDLLMSDSLSSSAPFRPLQFDEDIFPVAPAIPPESAIH